MTPDGFYHLTNYGREKDYTWENTIFYFQGPKAIQQSSESLVTIHSDWAEVIRLSMRKTFTVPTKLQLAKAKPKPKGHDWS